METFSLNSLSGLASQPKLGSVLSSWPYLDVTGPDLWTGFLVLPSWFDLGSALSACFCLMVWILGCFLWAHPAWLTWGCRAGYGVTSVPGLPSLGEKTCFCCSLLSSSVCVSAQRWGTVLSQWQKMMAPTHFKEVLLLKSSLCLRRKELLLTVYSSPGSRKAAAEGSDKE